MYYLIGEKLKHSYSKTIHNGQGFEYELKELDRGEVGDFLTSRNFDGLNVTIPYKESVLPYIEKSKLVESVGACNTIAKRDGKLFGFNTDVFGLKKALIEKKIEVNGKKTLILGSGGASKAAVKAVTELGGNPIVVSRKGENNYDNLFLHYDAGVIINATPVGMSPDCDGRILDLKPFKNLDGVMDFIYNPDKTPLIMQAEELGLKWQNGLSMLIWQALASEELFTGKAKDETEISIDKRPNLFLKNIVLIGMPFSGKSTIGKELSRICGFEFVDVDEEIERQGKTIPEIFASGGESEFRKIEKTVIREIAKKSQKIIATGGGAVLDGENVYNLKQNGVLVLLNRDGIPSDLNGRPLVKNSDDFAALKEKRKNYYMAAQDVIVSNDKDVGAVAREILKKVGLDENISS